MKKNLLFIFFLKSFKTNTLSTSKIIVYILRVKFSLDTFFDILFFVLFWKMNAFLSSKARRIGFFYMYFSSICFVANAKINTCFSQCQCLFQYPKRVHKTISLFSDFAYNLLVSHFSDEIIISHQCILKFATQQN